MKNEFIPYEEALELKELGFDKPCFGYWKMSDWLIEEKTRTDGYTHADQLCSAPTFSQAFRWFREKYNLHHVITIANLGKFEEGNPDFQCAIYSKNPVLITNMNECNSYEEAELTCLKKLIEIVRA